MRTRKLGVEVMTINSGRWKIERKVATDLAGWRKVGNYAKSEGCLEAV